MDEKTRQVMDTLAGVLGCLTTALLNFILAIHIAKSDMKAFWKVMGIDLAIGACCRSLRKQQKIIDEAIAIDDSIEYVKKVK